MNLSEMKKLVGHKRYLVPLPNLYFKVEIVDIKRKFGHILAKIVPHIVKTADIKNPPKDTWDFKNFAWVRLSTLTTLERIVKDRSPRLE